MKSCEKLEDVKNLMKKLEISVIDANENLRNFAEVFLDLKRAMEKMDEQQKLDIIASSSQERK